MGQELIFHLKINGPGGEKEIQVLPGISQIGRQEGNQILLADSQVSRQHARLECIQTECHLVDLGSSNGTYLNSEKLQPHSPILLKDGDQIKIGPFSLNFSQIAVKSEQPLPPLPEDKEPAISQREEKAPKKPEGEKITSRGKIPPPPAEKASATFEKEPDIFSSPEYLHSRKLLQYLPGIFHTDFMSRFLALFESILLPLEWTIDNFDLFLSPDTSPSGFLPWLENWFSLPPAIQWNETQKRTFLSEAHQLYARRGTRWALTRLIEIHCGCQAKITDTGEKLEPFTFIVEVPLKKEQVDLEALFSLIDSSKPAYTIYRLEFK